MMDDEIPEGQGAFGTTADMVEDCARLAARGQGAADGLVGVAPVALRQLLALELDGVDPDRWLAARGIRVVWRATEAAGAVSDFETSRTDTLTPRVDLVLWPAAAE
jgi:hypothetical protein